MDQPDVIWRARTRRFVEHAFIKQVALPRHTRSRCGQVLQSKCLYDNEHRTRCLRCVSLLALDQQLEREDSMPDTTLKPENLAVFSVQEITADVARLEHELNAESDTGFIVYESDPFACLVHDLWVFTDSPERHDQRFQYLAELARRQHLGLLQVCAMRNERILKLTDAAQDAEEGLDRRDTEISGLTHELEDLKSAYTVRGNRALDLQRRLEASEQQIADMEGEHAQAIRQAVAVGDAAKHYLVLPSEEDLSRVEDVFDIEDPKVLESTPPGALVGLLVRHWREGGAQNSPAHDRKTDILLEGLSKSLGPAPDADATFHAGYGPNVSAAGAVGLRTRTRHDGLGLCVDLRSDEERYGGGSNPKVPVRPDLQPVKVRVKCCECHGHLEVEFTTWRTNTTTTKHISCGFCAEEYEISLTDTGGRELKLGMMHMVPVPDDDPERLEYKTSAGDTGSTTDPGAIESLRQGSDPKLTVGVDLKTEVVVFDFLCSGDVHTSVLEKPSPCGGRVLGCIGLSPGTEDYSFERSCSICGTNYDLNLDSTAFPVLRVEGEDLEAFDGKLRLYRGNADRGGLFDIGTATSWIKPPQAAPPEPGFGIGPPAGPALRYLEQPGSMYRPPRHGKTHTSMLVSDAMAAELRGNLERKIEGLDVDRTDILERLRVLEKSNPVHVAGIQELSTLREQDLERIKDTDARLSAVDESRAEDAGCFRGRLDELSAAFESLERLLCDRLTTCEDRIAEEAQKLRTTSLKIEELSSKTEVVWGVTAGSEPLRTWSKQKVIVGELSGGIDFEFECGSQLLNIECRGRVRGSLLLPGDGVYGTTFEGGRLRGPGLQGSGFACDCCDATYTVEAIPDDSGEPKPPRMVKHHEGQPWHTEIAIPRKPPPPRPRTVADAARKVLGKDAELEVVDKEPEGE